MAIASLNKILYIEDDPHIRKLVQLTLEDKGLRVITCSSWNEALDLARKDQPDLLLLDVMLPEKNGVDTLSALRQLPGLENTPAIFLTVDADLATTDGFDNLHRYAIIAKPFQVDRLVQDIYTKWERLTT